MNRAIAASGHVVINHFLASFLQERRPGPGRRSSKQSAQVLLHAPQTYSQPHLEHFSDHGPRCVALPAAGVHPDVREPALRHLVGHAVGLPALRLGSRLRRQLTQARTMAGVFWWPCLPATWARASPLRSATLAMTVASCARKASSWAACSWPQCKSWLPLHTPTCWMPPSLVLQARSAQTRLTR